MTPFDLTVDRRDPKTGQIVERDPYVMHCNKDGTYFERPPGSGIMYAPDGTKIKDPEADKARANLEALKAKEEEANKVLKAKEEETLKTLSVADIKARAQGMKETK